MPEQTGSALLRWYTKAATALAKNAEYFNFVSRTPDLEAEDGWIEPLPAREKYPCRKIVFTILGREQSLRDLPRVSNSRFVATVDKQNRGETRTMRWSTAATCSLSEEPRERKPTEITHSLCGCHYVLQRTVWRYDRDEGIKCPYTVQGFVVERNAKSGRDFVRTMEINDRVIMWISMGGTPEDQPYISVISHVQVDVHWAI